jgi:acylglycerol lipase
MKYSEGQFKGAGGLNLYYRCWLPDGEPKAILIIVHGLGEHIGRYVNLVDYLVPRGYAVYGYDQRGHGKSEGVKGYVDRFSDFVDDLNLFFKLVQSRHDSIKTFLMGHSMGSTVAASYTILHQEEFNGLILTGTLLTTPASVNAGTILAARLLSMILPAVGLYVIDAEAISRDKSVVSAYVNDPLVYRGKIRARLGVEIIKGMKTTKQQISRIKLPILVMHGSADLLSNPKDSEMLCKEASSEDKTLKLYEGYYHEIFNEQGHEQVLADIESWLITRV